jgi:hypothetical protein
MLLLDRSSANAWCGVFCMLRVEEFWQVHVLSSLGLFQDAAQQQHCFCIDADLMVAGHSAHAESCSCLQQQHTTCSVKVTCYGKAVQGPLMWMHFVTPLAGG